MVLVSSDSHPYLLVSLEHALLTTGCTLMSRSLHLPFLSDDQVERVEEHVESCFSTLSSVTCQLMIDRWMLSGEGSPLVMERGEAACALNGVSPQGDLALILHSVSEGDL